MPDEDKRQRRNRLAREAYQRRRARLEQEAAERLKATRDLVDADNLSLGDKPAFSDLALRKQPSAHMAPKLTLVPDTVDSRDDDELTPEELSARRLAAARASTDPDMLALVHMHEQGAAMAEAQDTVLDKRIQELNYALSDKPDSAELAAYHTRREELIKAHERARSTIPPDPFSPDVIRGMREEAEGQRVKEASAKQNVAESERLYSAHPTRLLERWQGSFHNPRPNKGAIPRQGQRLDLDALARLKAYREGVGIVNEGQHQALSQRVGKEAQAPLGPAWAGKPLSEEEQRNAQAVPFIYKRRAPWGKGQPISRVGSVGPKPITPTPLAPPVVTPTAPTPLANAGGAATLPPEPPTPQAPTPVNVTLTQQKQRIGIPPMTLFGFGLALILCNFLLQADPGKIMDFFTHSPQSAADANAIAVLPAQAGITLAGEVLFLFIIVQLAALNGAMNALVTGFIGLMWLLWIIKNQQKVFGDSSLLGTAFRVIFRQQGSLVPPEQIQH